MIMAHWYHWHPKPRRPRVATSRLGRGARRMRMRARIISYRKMRVLLAHHVATCSKNRGGDHPVGTLLHLQLQLASATPGFPLIGTLVLANPSAEQCTGTYAWP